MRRRRWRTESTEPLASGVLSLLLAYPGRPEAFPLPPSMPPNRYNPIHALAAAIVLTAAVWKNFWHNFLHGGFTSPPTPAVVMFVLGCQIALFGTLLLFIWCSTLFARRHEDAAADARWPLMRAMRFTLIAFGPICIIALGLEWTSTVALERLFDIKPAGQDLVLWLKPGTYPISIRLLLMAFALFEAPLVEEPLFRGVMFRGFAKAMPAWAAMAASGFVFALIHVNAATFLPLWYLGVAFAWLYWRTGTILAPMAAHFLFNLLNLVLVLMGVAE